MVLVEEEEEEKGLRRLPRRRRRKRRRRKSKIRASVQQNKSHPVVKSCTTLLVPLFSARECPCVCVPPPPSHHPPLTVDLVAIAKQITTSRGRMWLSTRAISVVLLRLSKKNGWWEKRSKKRNSHSFEIKEERRRLSQQAKPNHLARPESSPSHGSRVHLFYQHAPAPRGWSLCSSDRSDALLGVSVSVFWGGEGSSVGQRKKFSSRRSQQKPAHSFFRGEATQGLINEQ